MHSDAFSDHFDPALQLDDPGFDLGANLETKDSMSSLDQLGVSEDVPPDMPPREDTPKEAVDGGKEWEEFGKKQGTVPETVANGNTMEKGNTEKQSGKCRI